LSIQANLDLRNFKFTFLNRELFAVRNIYVLNLKTGWPKNQILCQHMDLTITEGGIYPQLPTQPKKFVHCSKFELIQ